MNKDLVVAHFFIRLVRWNLEYDHIFAPTAYELGLKLKALLRPEVELSYQSPRSWGCADQITQLAFSCCSLKARRRFSAFTITTLIGNLNEAQQQLAVQVMEDLHGDYYRDNLIYEFERSITPRNIGYQAERIGFSVNCGSD